VTDFRFLATDEDPAVALRWLDRPGGSVLDLSAATFTVKLINSAGAVALTSAGTTTGYSSAQGTSPHTYNFLHSFSAGELATLSGVYTLLVQATISSRQRTFAPDDLPTVRIVAVPA
jgi:hypothetical protein